MLGNQQLSAPSGKPEKPPAEACTWASGSRRIFLAVKNGGNKAAVPPHHTDPLTRTTTTWGTGCETGQGMEGADGRFNSASLWESKTVQRASRLTIRTNSICTFAPRVRPEEGNWGAGPPFPSPRAGRGRDWDTRGLGSVLAGQGRAGGARAGTLGAGGGAALSNSHALSAHLPPPSHPKRTPFSE